ncbi:TIGR03545 family protein [Ectothiorhodospiraceae bacterium WFHF3C12]|nr:TIGR03545 family protein [Ectothiorhodospiraceae bacterium WFHF3C12]
MLRWLRWQGLVGFVVVMALLAGSWVLFADRLVKWAVEGTGTAMVGARVELDSADVALAPLRIEMQGLRVTNPNAPMRNAFEAGRIAFDADTLGLLLDRVDIGEVAVEGLRLNTPRERSGAVGRPPSEGPGLLDRTARSLEIPALELPTAEQALAAAQLRSPGVIEAAREDMRRQRDTLEQRVDELPTEASIADYESRLERIREGGGDLTGRLSQARDAKALLDDVRGDLKAVRKARDAARETVSAAEDNARKAREAPEADIRRLVDKYSDPATVAQELVRYVLGPRVAGWVNGGWYWYQRLAPYLGRLQGGEDEPPAVKVPRSEGRRVIFTEADPRPETLVRRVALSGAGGEGTLGGEITDIAAPASLWPRPLRFDLRGNDLPGLAGLAAQGQLRQAAGQSRADVSLQLSGAALSADAPDAGGIAIEDGIADLEIDGQVGAGTLDLRLDGRFRQVGFALGAEAGERVRQMGELLEGVSSFDLSVRITGTPESPELALRSSLADTLKRMVGQVAGQKVQAFRAALRDRIGERVAEPLAAVDENLEALRGAEQTIADRQSRLKALEDRLGRILG